MEYYKASQAPDAQEWLDMDEAIRIDWVRDSIGKDDEDDVPEDSKVIHATIHVVVENQLAMGVEPVPATLSKLVRQGLTRHEAIHAIGAILSEDISDILKSNNDAGQQNHYRKRLEKLTAKRWRKGQWS